MSTTFSRAQQPRLDLGLALVDVERRTRELARPESVDERRLVHDRPARGVDENGGTRHRAKRGPVDEVPRLRRERHVDADDVRLGEERVEVVGSACERRAGAECLGQRRRLASDSAGSRR